MKISKFVKWFLVSIALTGCGSSTNSITDNNDTNVSDNNDTNHNLGEPTKIWGTAKAFSKRKVSNTLEFEFLIYGDPQPDYSVHLWEGKMERMGYLVSSMNSHIKNHSPVGAIGLGDLTQHGCAQEVIAFRQNFENDYYHSGVSRGNPNEDTYKLKTDKPLQVPSYLLIGNHSDTSRNICQDTCCSSMNNNGCFADYTQTYIRQRIAKALYEPPTTLGYRIDNHYKADIGDIYTFEWGSYHFIVADLWMGYRGWYHWNETKVSKLNWLKNYLEIVVGKEKPVLLFQHYGWDGFSTTPANETSGDRWWTAKEQKELVNILCGRDYDDYNSKCEPYNVLGFFTGHTHEEKHHNIYDYAGGNKVKVFDNYIVDDSGPADEGKKTGYYIVKLGVDSNDATKGTIQIDSRTHHYTKTNDGEGGNVYSSSYISGKDADYRFKTFNLAFMDWEQGEPNNGGGNGDLQEGCAELKSNGRLNDVECDQNKSFLCKTTDGKWLFTQEMGTWNQGTQICKSNNATYESMEVVSDQYTVIHQMKNNQPQPLSFAWTNLRSPWISRYKVSDALGDNSSAGGIAVGNINNTKGKDIVTYHVYDAKEGNHAYYRVGFDSNALGEATSWSDTFKIPNEIGKHTAGGGIAIGDIENDGKSNLITMYIDSPSGENSAHYQISHNISKDGSISEWYERFKIDAHIGEHTAGAGIAIGDITNSGKLNLIILYIDNPDGENSAYYRVSSDIKADGSVTSWSNAYKIPVKIGAHTSGAGIAIGDIDNDGELNLIITYIDNPDGDNHAYYCIGSDINNNPPSWSGAIMVPGWFGKDSSGAGIAITDIDNDKNNDLIIYHIDNPHGDDYGYYRVGLGKNIPKFDADKKISPMLKPYALP